MAAKHPIEGRFPEEYERHRARFTEVIVYRHLRAGISAMYQQLVRSSHKRSVLVHDAEIPGSRGARG